MSIDISQEQARRFLASYHLAPTDLPGVFARLGTVQYDPLNPVGRNADLVLQARVPGDVNRWINGECAGISHGVMAIYLLGH